MLKVLVVDDEAYIRRGIVGKVKHLMDYCEVVGEAQNGEEGINLAEKEKPDIVITDIKMPKVDGLLFIEKTLELSPRTKFIIVSGYDDFNYARQAVKLGVFDYLLKPVSNGELKSALDNLKVRIENERERDVVLDHVRERTEKNAVLRRNKRLSKLAQCAGDEAQRLEELASLAPNMKGGGAYTACALAIERAGGFDFEEGEREIWKFAVSNVFEECMAKACACAAYYNEDGRGYIYALIRPNSEKDEVCAAVRRAVSETAETLGLELHAGVSREFIKLEDFGNAIREAEYATMQRALYPEKNVLSHEDYEAVKNNDYRISEEKRRLIGYHMDFLSTNLEELKKVIGDICDTMAQKKVSYSNMKAVCLDLVLMLFNDLKDKNPEIYQNVIDKDRDIGSYFENLYAPRQFKERIFSLLESMAEFMKEDELMGGKRIVSDIVRRVETEYYQDLKLSALAAEYYMNQSYLSTLFMKETGKNFSRYLADVRMQKAKELLVTTQFSVSRIAEFVGYSDRSYFTTVFQRTLGMSPAAYRRLEKELEEEPDEE